jgi:hypothetical protein
MSLQRLNGGSEGKGQMAPSFERWRGNCRRPRRTGTANSWNCCAGWNANTLGGNPGRKVEGQ